MREPNLFPDGPSGSEPLLKAYFGKDASPNLRLISADLDGMIAATCLKVKQT